MMGRHIVILGSLDTKAAEIAFLRAAVRAQGGEPLVLDTGVLGEPGIEADVTRHQVAAAAGTTIAELISRGDKSHALLCMAEGAARLVLQMLREGRLGGVLSIGGSRGTALGTRVMQTLPVGVPKLMVSTMASGHNSFGPYVGSKDVTLMHSVADVMGINAVTRPIFGNAAAAIVAMSRVGAPVRRAEATVFAASMLGASTPLVSHIRTRVAGEGGELIAFHAQGTGGRSMEEMIEGGLVDGVFDVSPGEVVAELLAGPYSAGPDRMRAAGRRGIPQVVAPGGVDFIILDGPLEALPTRYRGRKTLQHTPALSLVRTSAAEMAAAGRAIAARLAESTGPAAAILPRRGFGAFSTPGQPLWDPEADRAFAEAFKASAPSRVRILELDAALNDPPVAEAAVRLMREMMRRT
jgi:uncharacterized protein (UPF0261 family)